MSLCPICVRALCDHSAKERGQTEEEMLKPLSNEEIVKRNNEKLIKKMGGGI